MKISSKVCGQAMVWKIDTGAKKTFITSRTYNNIQHRLRSGLRPMKNKFLAANGNEVECDGETSVLISFNGHDIYFPVVVGGVTENILGKDFIEQFQCNFDHKNKTFVILKKDKFGEPEKNGSNIYEKVVAAETVEVPSGTEMLVPLRVKGSNSVKQSILIPEAKFVKTHNLLVARVLVDNANSIPARVLNPGNSNVRIMKGTVIA